MPKIALVIFNSTAGINIKADVKKMVKDKLFDHGFEVDWFYLNRNFEQRIAGYNFSRPKLVVAVGGDGTVKVAARTILENRMSAKLLIVPFGSANVIAISLGIPITLKKSLALLTMSSDVEKIDVGLINSSHYFLVGFSVGYVSSLVTQTPARFKKRFGFLAYVINFLFNKIKIRKIKFKIQTRKRIYEQRGNSLVVFNALNYFGIQPKKKIDLHDGVFNLYVFTNRHFWSLMEAAFYMLWYQSPPRHIFSLDDSYFKVILDHRRRSCQIDGDYIRLPKEIEIKMLPAALSVVVPTKKHVKHKKTK